MNLCIDTRRGVLNSIATAGLAFQTLWGGGYEGFIELTASDSMLKSSMVDGKNWSDGNAPTPSGDYYVPNGLTIYTPSESYTTYFQFPGRTLACGGTLVNALVGFKGFGVADLRMLPGFSYKQVNMNFVGKSTDVWTVEGTSDQPARFSILFAYGKNTITFHPKFIAGGDAVLEAFRHNPPFSKEWFESHPNYVYYTPDKMLQQMNGSFEEFYGTFRIATNAAVLVSSGMRSMPGTFEIEGGGFLRNDMSSGSFTVGTMKMHENATVYFNLSPSGDVCPYTITNALICEAGKPWTISFEDYYGVNDISPALSTGTLNLKLFTLSGHAAESVPDLSSVRIDAKPEFMAKDIYLSVKDEGEDRGVYLCTPESSGIIYMTNSCSSASFDGSAFHPNNGAYWSTGEIPTPESSAGKTLYATKNIQLTGYLTDNQRDFNFPETSLVIGGRLSAYFHVTSLAFKDIRLLDGITIYIYGSGVLDQSTGFYMADIASPVYSDGATGNGICAFQERGFVFKKGIVGNNTFTFTTVRGHARPFGCVSLEGDNSGFTGQLQFTTPTFAAKEGSYEACPDEDSGRFFTATFNSGLNFGGAYTGASLNSWRSIYVNGHTLMRMTNDVAIVEPSRTMFVEDCGRFEVSAGKTFSLDAPLTLKGEFRKTGAGRLSLGGEMRFADASNPDPQAGTNAFNVAEGEVMFRSVNSANGLAMTFSDGAKLVIDPESDAAKSETGFIATRWANPLVSAAADGKIAVELAPSASFVPADKFSVPICTVPNAAAKSINFNVRRSQRHLATLRTVENQDGTVTFVADYSRKGSVMTIR